MREWLWQSLICCFGPGSQHCQRLEEESPEVLRVGPGNVCLRKDLARFGGRRFEQRVSARRVDRWRKPGMSALFLLHLGGGINPTVPVSAERNAPTTPLVSPRLPQDFKTAILFGFYIFFCIFVIAIIVTAVLGIRPCVGVQMS